MPITIVERAEVLTEASRIPSAPPPLLIRSNAVRLLTHELRRYCKREVSGRSFLIAGHRGAGKTTLVLNACQEIIKQSEVERFPLRPLLVMLQGPNLLPNEEDELPVVAEEGEKPGGEPKKITPMENVLRQITLGLYRALAREMSQAFRNHVMGLASGSESPNGVPRSELIEFAAALELELDEYPGKSRLRRFWHTAGILETGVLRPRPVAAGATAKRKVSLVERVTEFFGSGIATFFALKTTTLSHPVDQGFRELVALCSACEAYRRISGTFTSKQEDRQGAKATEKLKIEADLKGREILAPIMPVLVGALAGTCVLATKIATGPQAAFVGASAAIASAFALKYSRIRFRERSATREDLFLPDLRVATLDRVLPVLIDRVHAAGLAPIFVIDELDKVERLSIRIPEMIRRLKKLVAENAFFCFLTDRTYYEQMRKREVKNPYSIEHTYFTHQLFIIFRHRDLHTFLEDVLQPPNAPSEAQQVSTGVPADREAQTQTQLERDDAQVLQFLLLYAARMHSIDLRRELMQIRGDDGNVTLTSGYLQASRRYGLELQMQVAIETLLDEDDMERELDRHPEFRRLAHDALYYLAEKWEDPDDTLDLHSEEALMKFKEYLCSRMVTDPPDITNGFEPVPASQYVIRKSQKRKKHPVNNNGSEGELPAIPDSDLEFLWTRVRELAELLCSPKKLLERARKRNPPPFPEVVLKAVSQEPLLAQGDGGEHSYCWCWYPAGRQIGLATSSQTLGPERETPSWESQEEFIRAFAAAILKVPGAGDVTFADLGTNLSIISTSPPWKSVEEAMARLKTSAKTGSYAREAEDADIVAKFDALLKRSAAPIAYALCAARVLKPQSRPEVGADMALPLATISSCLSLRNASEANVAELMRELFQQIHRRFDAGKPTPAPPPVNEENEIHVWEKWVRDQTARIEGAVGENSFKNLAEIQTRAWSDWYARLTSRDVAPVSVSVDSLICAHRVIGPGQYLTLPVEEMTVQKWSGAFYGALNVAPANDTAERTRPWLALAALSRLGFSERVATLREQSVAAGQLFQNQELSEQRRDELRTWPLDPKALSPKRSALVLRRSEPGLVGAWKPDPAFPVLTLSRTQGEDLRANGLLENLKAILAPEMVILDLAAMPAAQGELHPDELENAFLLEVPLRPDLPLDTPIVLPADLLPPPAGYLCIINPKNSEELFRPLTQQEQTAGRILQPAPAQ